jgi:hypothetical protein
VGETVGAFEALHPQAPPAAPPAAPAAPAPSAVVPGDDGNSSQWGSLWLTEANNSHGYIGGTRSALYTFLMASLNNTHAGDPSTFPPSPGPPNTEEAWRPMPNTSAPGTPNTPLMHQVHPIHL